ncbi:MAG TPA: hypothetical protein VJP79_07765 [Nitrososphaera sp.]|nr:hypothetical protein [Nitrososphaera sp.]
MRLIQALIIVLAFTTILSVLPAAVAETIVLDVSIDGQDYILRYLITHARIINTIANPDTNSITVFINSTGDGILRLELPLQIIKSEQESTGTIVPFFVKVDGSEVLYNDTGTVNQSRILDIPFKQGQSEIQIIGTWMVPEFPTAMLGLLGALMFMAVLITRSKQFSVITF